MLQIESVLGQELEGELKTMSDGDENESKTKMSVVGLCMNISRFSHACDDEGRRFYDRNMS